MYGVLIGVWDKLINYTYVRGHLYQLGTSAGINKGHLTSALTREGLSTRFKYTSMLCAKPPDGARIEKTLYE